MVIMGAKSGLAYNQTVSDKLKLAAPLMPPIFAIMTFIGLLSPLTWSVPGLVVKVFIAILGVSIVAAYCITGYLQDLQKSIT
jgi:hypothetical protein